MKKNQIIKKTIYWAGILCCNEIDLKISFRKFTKEEVKEVSDGCYTPLAFVETNARYMESFIFFNSDKLNLIKDEDIVHELLHIKLNELTGYLYANEETAKADKWKGYFEERFVSQMAKIITRL